MANTFLLATDGSGPARRAESYARKILAAEDKLILLTVADQSVVDEAERLPEEVKEEEPTLKNFRDHVQSLARETLDETMERLGDLPNEMETKIHFGKPGQEICQYAQERRVDGIIIGRRGLGGDEFLMGSVSSYVTHHSDVPVIVVPPGYEP